jgi:transposase
MERIPKGVYTPEFRSEAVKLVETTGMTASRAARQLPRLHLLEFAP